MVYNPKILYKLPSRTRPTKLISTIDNIHLFSKHDNYSILVSLDFDDASMNNQAIKDRLSQYPRVITVWGLSTGKINSINRDMEKVDDWHIVIGMADDMEWIEPGFDLEIIKVFAEYFPDFDGIVHFPDQIAGKRLMTLPIIGRKYYDRFGYIYFNGYNSVCADDEQMEVGQLLRKYVFIDKVMFNHNHPVWQLTEWDDLYRRNEAPSHYAQDGALLKARREIKFGLNL